MILVLVCCLLFSILMAGFVSAPLFLERERAWSGPVHDGFADEDDLRRTLDIRDTLLDRLLGQGDLAARALPAALRQGLQGLSDGASLDVLTSVCLRLKRAGLPFLPVPVATNAANETQSIDAALSSQGPIDDKDAASGTTAGSASGARRLLVWLIFPWLALAPLALSDAKAAPAPAAAPSSSAPAPATPMPKIPPPIEKAPGLFLSPVHQYVLSPRMGELYVFYTGVISQGDTPGERSIIIPAPKGFRDLALPNLPKATIESQFDASPVIRVPLSPGINEIRAEFSIPAPFGTAHWANDEFGDLPGIVVLLMPEYESVARKLLEPAIPDLNLWPARIIHMPASFQSRLAEESVDPSDPNYKLFLKMPPQYTRQAIRSSQAEPRTFPTFDVTGIVPSRTPLVVLAILLGSFLFSVAAFTMINGARSQARQKSVA